jgi:hypothetical protein
MLAGRNVLKGRAAERERQMLQPCVTRSFDS